MIKCLQAGLTDLRHYQVDENLPPEKLALISCLVGGLAPKFSSNNFRFDHSQDVAAHYLMDIAFIVSSSNNACVITG